MATIISSLGAKALSMSVDQFFRTVPWGYNWTTVRLGLLCNFAIAQNTTGGIAVGFCSARRPYDISVNSRSDLVCGYWGTGAAFSSAYTTVSGCLKTPYAPPGTIWDSSGPLSYNVKSLSNYTSTVKYRDGYSTSPLYMAAGAVAKNAWIVDVTKLSNFGYSTTQYCYNSTANALIDVSTSTYNSWMALADPSSGGVLVNTSAQATGLWGANQLDSLFVMTNLPSNALNIYKMDVIRLA